jgi:hypothetical protein
MPVSNRGRRDAPRHAKGRTIMANLVHFHIARAAFLEEEWLRMVAKRAVAKPDFPFESAGAAMVLAQLELSAGLKVHPEK